MTTASEIERLKTERNKARARHKSTLIYDHRLAIFRLNKMRVELQVDADLAAIESQGDIDACREVYK